MIWGLLSGQSEESLLSRAKNRLGLETCAEPRNKWDDFSQDDFEKRVRSGYTNWGKDKNTRVTGQSAKGPESPEEAGRSENEKLIRRDNQLYFSSSLVSSGPNKAIKPQDNWYSLMTGEWDVAYIINSGTPDETLIAGEWLFTWINNGQAIQDVLSVPYQWQKSPANFTPLQVTTTRMLNAKRSTWEGFHIMNSSLVYFGVTKTPQNQIMEHYQTEDGQLIVWLYSDLSSTSFKVTISQSADKGATYTKVGEMWTKRRETVIP
jgi:hypothetical protein